MIVWKLKIMIKNMYYYMAFILKFNEFNIKRVCLLKQEPVAAAPLLALPTVGSCDKTHGPPQ